MQQETENPIMVLLAKSGLSQDGMAERLSAWVPGTSAHEWAECMQTGSYRMFSDDQVKRIKVFFDKNAGLLHQAMGRQPMR